ncbi:methyl-accepting chemotaxis protein [Clostridium cylindrosporum]|uniref:Methyl-accepting chemotaxis protein n=1 Tax=Clostridium cylindrosporum DSM 605 TaxID=1121307 RepID=A0A0J8G4D1_CLOCY|nr:methyl-accepting chemotaxis protein [Clostridium cylindrosporum]KMT22526.1 methyl-accepting chemotaxis protein [Clostridium cylindrosporum DSM 605]
MKEQRTLLESTKRTNKIFSLIVITSILFGVLTILASFKTNSLNNERFLLQEYSAKLKGGSDYLTDQIKLYAATGDIKYCNNYEKEVTETKTTTKYLGLIEDIGINSDEKKLIETSKNESDTLINLEEEAIKNARQGNLKKAQELVLGNTYDSKKASIDSYVLKFQAAIMERSERTVIIFEVILFLLILITVGLSCIILYTFSKYSRFIKERVISPIIALKNCFSEISKGNLETSIDLDEDNTEIGEFTTVAKNTQSMLKDYIEDISTSLNRISRKDITTSIEKEYIGDFEEIKTSINGIVSFLNETISEINVAAKQVALGSEEIASTSTALSEGASDQAGSVEELSASINEIYNDIRQNADNSKDVSNILNLTVEKIKDSDKKMNDMLIAMENISSASNEISRIISTISSVAFQTNLLAVNTSIEASKANVQGKQFTVIAEEIRTLANTSANAVKETTALINESISAVENGNSLARETAEMLHGIVSDSEKISNLVKEISLVSEKQALSTEEITKGIDEIAAVVQTNSATAEESAAASEELASQSELLSTAVSEFKLINN